LASKKNYDKFYNKNIDFLLDYFIMHKNKEDKDSGGKPSKEYGRLIQAKKRLKDTFSDGLEGALLFNDLMHAGQTKVKNREQFGIYHRTKKTPKLDNLKLYLEDKENPSDELRRKMHAILDSLQVEFVQEIFTEERLERLFLEMFRFNHHHNEDLLREDQIEYYANVSALMVQVGIDQIKKFLDIEYSRLLHQDLDRVKEIASIVRKQKDKEIRVSSRN